jgi:hypothetical protein
MYGTGTSCTPFGRLPRVRGRKTTDRSAELQEKSLRSLGVFAVSLYLYFFDFGPLVRFDLAVKHLQSCSFFKDLKADAPAQTSASHRFCFLL